MNPKQLLITMLLFLTIAISAEVPQMINYQAQLLDPTTDQPIADDTYQITFKIYDTEAATTAIWTEMHQVQTQTGMYNVLLGSQYPVTNEILTGAEKWLGVQVGTDNEMLPRKRFTSVAYSVKSETDDDWIKDGDDIYIETGNVGIGTNTPDDNAILQLESVSKGFQIPRMTTEQRLNIANPSVGLEVFDIDAVIKIFYNGTRWLEIGGDPIGTIKAWHKDFTNTPSLPWGWIECNGQSLSDTESPYDGEIIPDLNGDGRFLRGSATSGSEQSATRIPNFWTRYQSGAFEGASDGTGNHSIQNGEDPGQDSSGYCISSGEYNTMYQFTLDYAVRPINMSVVYIMRVK
jgi:hypothetical protein